MTRRSRREIERAIERVDDENGDRDDGVRIEIDGRGGSIDETRSRIEPDDDCGSFEFTVEFGSGGDDV